MIDKVNQLLLAFYIGYLAIAKFLIGVYPNESFYILSVPLITTVIVSVALNIKNKYINFKPIIILLIAAAVLGISFLVAGNSESFSYTYQFLIYGAMPLLLLSRVARFDHFIKYFAYISIVTVILLGFDPVNGYILTTDYMTYGYFVMLPAYVAFYVSRKYYNKKILFPFEVFSLILMAIYANQGTVLSAITLIVLCNIFVDKVDFRKALAIVTVAIVAVLVMVNIKPILEVGIQIADENGQASYSLRKARDSLEGGGDSLSGRSELWDSAGEMIASKPVLGHGVGAYQSQHGVYAHNIFLETTVSFGIVGLVILVLLMAIYIRNALVTKRDLRLTYVLGFALGIVPLMFSMHMFMWLPFWIYTLNPEIKMNFPRKTKKKWYGMRIYKKHKVPVNAESAPSSTSREGVS